MAIFHLAHSFLGRSNGASSVAKAAYNSGEKIEDNKGSTAFSDYTRKGGVLCGEISLPAGSPQWANNRGELWRRLEAREDKSTRRADAILAHNIDLALPHELTLEQNIFLLKDFVREQFARKGYAVDWSIHAPDPRGDDRNFHAHILAPLRKIDGESFGKKDRYTKQQLSQKVTGLRRSWAKLTNHHLKRYGHKAQIDERSLRAQGIKRAPTRHKGIRPKVKGSSFNGIRPSYPRSPGMQMSKTIGADGSVRVRAVITHSALNNIGSSSPSPIFPIRPTRKGWPEAALRDWEAWGSKNPPRFFQVWSELASPA
ncbi:MAG: MobQ family relaxase [Alphaproteobacteria bacterium]